MNLTRRDALKSGGGLTLLTLVAAAGWLPSGDAVAAEWNRAAFDTHTMSDTLKALGGSPPMPSKDIAFFSTPDIAENGAVVPIGVTSAVPKTDAIAILIEKNPNMLTALFELPPGTEPSISTRVKMAQNQRMISEDVLPDAAARKEQASKAAAALARAGYQAIGLDHFALPGDAMAVAAREGKLRRNFQGYTTDIAETMIGFGATSIGRTPSGYYQNIAETGAWARAVADGTPPVAKGLALSDDDRLRGRVIERIMCDGTVDPVAIGAEHGRAADWCADEMAALGEMGTDGLVIREGDRIVLTSDGLALSRVVASVFDACLARSEARHSVAV